MIRFLVGFSIICGARTFGNFHADFRFLQDFSRYFSFVLYQDIRIIVILLRFSVFCDWREAKFTVVTVPRESEIY